VIPPSKTKRLSDQPKLTPRYPEVFASGFFLQAIVVKDNHINCLTLKKDTAPPEPDSRFSSGAVERQGLSRCSLLSIKESFSSLTGGETYRLLWNRKRKYSHATLKSA
jgi:hypothetical protein